MPLPPPRSYSGELNEAVSSQRGILPNVISGEAEAALAYQNLQRNSLMGQLGVMRDLYGAYTPVAAQISGQSLQTMAPMYGQAAGYASNAFRQGIGSGGMGLLDLMTSQARGDLEMGGNLTPQQLAYAQQDARRASTARGLTSSNIGIANEILNTYKVRNAREDRARNYATSVYGLNQNLASVGSQLYGSPIMSLISSTSPTTLLGQSLQYQGAQGNQYIQPESQYLANVKGGNQNAAIQTGLANSQIRAGVGAGLMSMGGQMLGGYMQGRGQAGLSMFG